MTAPSPDTPRRRRPRISQERRCFWLLISLVLILILTVSTPKGTLNRLVAAIFGTTVLIGGLYTLSDTRRHLRTGIDLMAPVVLWEWINWAFEFTPSHPLLVPSFYHIPFYAYLIWVVKAYVFRPGDITYDRLHGAICIYILIGKMWTEAYVTVANLIPGAFKFAGPEPATQLERTSEFTYYSFVTLTTLGYGDVTPIAPMARALSLLEAITGVMVMGILIARLMGSLTVLGDSEVDESHPSR